MPLTKLPVRNRRIVKIDTGKTGKCRICIYLPKKMAGLQKEAVESRGVLVHLHGGGWTMFVSIVTFNAVLTDSRRLFSSDVNPKQRLYCVALCAKSLE